MCHCSAAVKEVLAPADKPGSTPGNAVFCFFVPFFFPFGLFLTLISLLAFFLYSYCWPCWCMHLDQYFKLKSRKGVFKAPDLHTGQAYDQKKTISCQEMSLLREFFSKLVNIITNNTQNTTNCANLHPTPPVTHWRKLNLPFVHRLNHQYYYPKIPTGFAPPK